MVILGLFSFFLSQSFASPSVISVSDINDKIFYFKVSQSLDPLYVAQLVEDLEQLGRETIPDDILEYREVFGDHSKTFLEWFSKRVDYFGSGPYRKSSLAEYTKNRFLFFRKAKSIYFADKSFYEGAISRRDTLIHEAYHFEKKFHVKCKSPSHLKNKNGCDNALTSSFGAGYLYSILPHHIEELVAQYSAIHALNYLAVGLDRILSKPDRRKMAKLFQKQLVDVNVPTRAALRETSEYVKKSINQNENTRDFYREHASDILELFVE